MSSLRPASVLGLLTAVAGVMMGFLHLGINLEEDLGLGFLFKMRGDRQPPPDVVVVAMDKESSVQLHLPRDYSKWPRSYHAGLVERLAGSGASVIALDISFKSESEQDPLLAGAIRRAKNVVLLEYIETERIPIKNSSGRLTGGMNVERVTPPPPALTREAAALAVFPLPKVPLKVSQFWTFKDGSGDLPTMPVVAFQVMVLQRYDDDWVRFLNRTLEKRGDSREGEPSDIARRLSELTREDILAGKKVNELIRSVKETLLQNPKLFQRMLEDLDDPLLHLDPQKKRIFRGLINAYRADGSRYLNFYGPPRTISTVPSHQLLQPLRDGEMAFPVDTFEGKVVFIGSSDISMDQKDGFHTVFSDASGFDLSGTEIAATAFGNLLEDFPVRPLPFPYYLFILASLGFVFGMACIFLPLAGAVAACLGLLLLYVFVAYVQFKTAGAWYPLVVPAFFQMPFAMVGSVLWKYQETTREREVIRKTFGHYVPDEVVNQLAKNLTDLKAGGQTVYGTCLYTDVVDYTGLSETMDPKDLRALMNEYYEAIFKPVKLYGGIVLEVKGDSMLAIWPGSRLDPQIRAKACLAAAQLVHALDQFNRSSQRPKINNRIGLHSGEVQLGSVGGGTYYSYTAVGDIINAASRIEELNKRLGTRLLVSHEVVEGLPDFLTRPLGTFLLVGKAKSLLVHELIGPIADCNDVQKRLCKNFGAALELFKMQRWNEARERFEEILKENRSDGPSLFYIELCRNFMENPPRETWDGIIRIDRK